MRCKIIINDEVNVKIEGLPVEIRRKIANKMKYEVPYARYLPQYKLGRWDGKVGFFGLGGNGYVNHLDTIINILQESGVEIEEIDDKRQKVDLQFDKIDKNYFDDPGYKDTENIAINYDKSLYLNNCPDPLSTECLLVV